MKRFRTFFEEAESGIQVFHGSEEDELNHIEANTPPYAGGIGHGVYVGTEIETAQFYGGHIYELRTKFGWDQVLQIGDDNYEALAYGESILTGEQVPPFAFYIGNKRYAVTEGTGWAEEDNWVTRDVKMNALYQYLGLEERGDSLQPTEETPDWVRAILPTLQQQRKHGEFPSDSQDFDDDLYVWADQNNRGTKYPGPQGNFLPGEIGQMGQKIYGQRLKDYESNLESSVEKVREYIDQAISHAEKAVESIGEQISMEEIGGTVEQAGYKAVHVVGIRMGAGVNEEMLVFDEDDLKFVKKIQ